jgi:ankyrin repeat protein
MLSLPDEILINIKEYLIPKEHGNLLLTCKKLFSKNEIEKQKEKQNALDNDLIFILEKCEKYFIFFISEVDNFLYKGANPNLKTHNKYDILNLFMMIHINKYNINSYNNKNYNEYYRHLKKYLKLGVNVNNSDRLCSRPLLKAISINDINVVKLFLEYGAEIEFTTIYGISPINLASVRKNDIYTLLLNKIYGRIEIIEYNI